MWALDSSPGHFCPCSFQLHFLLFNALPFPETAAACETGSCSFSSSSNSSLSSEIQTSGRLTRQSEKIPAPKQRNSSKWLTVPGRTHAPSIEVCWGEFVNFNGVQTVLGDGEGDSTAVEFKLRTQPSRVQTWLPTRNKRTKTWLFLITCPSINVMCQYTRKMFQNQRFEVFLVG